MVRRRFRRTIAAVELAFTPELNQNLRLKVVRLGGGGSGGSGLSVSSGRRNDFSSSSIGRGGSSTVAVVVDIVHLDAVLLEIVVQDVDSMHLASC